MNNKTSDSFVFPNHQVSIGIINQDKKFPIGKVYCVGRNYNEHIKEIKEDLKEEPFFFSKPPESITQKKVIKFPDDTKDLQYEAELVVFIGKECSKIQASDAHSYIYGYAAGIDLTKRDVQKIAKKKRRPWEFSKGFENSAPISLINASINKIIKQGKIELHQNKNLKQNGDISQMIWPVDQIICKLSHKITLYPGDVIFTGTPSGVGSISPGDNIRTSIEGVGQFEIIFEK